MSASKRKRQPLDLIAVRRQLTALRNQNSGDGRIVAMVNRLLVETACLEEPETPVQRERLEKKIARAVEHVQRLQHGKGHLDGNQPD